MAEQLTQQDVSWMDKFRNSVMEFRKAFDTLLHNRAYVASRPELQAEYNSLFNEGSMIKKTVETVAAGIDSVVHMASSAWSAVSDYLGFDAVPRSRGLGFLPLLPIAAISGAVALMAGYVAKVYLFNRKIEEAKRLESLGVSPKEAAAMTQGYGEKSLADTFDSMKVPLLIGGGLLLLYKSGLLNRGN